MKRIPHQAVDGIECKRCSYCKNYLPLQEFDPKPTGWDRLHRYCISCKKNLNKKRYLENQDKIKQKAAEHYKNNRNEINAARRAGYANDPEVKVKLRKYEEKNREKIAAQRKMWRAQNKDKIRDYDTKWKEENKEYYREWVKVRRRNRWNNDPEYRLLITLRTRINIAIRKQVKAGSSIELLGCSIDELKEYLEKMFKPGMSWDNREAWHIDHIRPCVSFDLSDPDQQFQCFHYTNLQPLWAEENLKKGALYEMV